MKHKFYDVKEKKSVEADVMEKVSYGSANKTRYAFKAQTQEGRNLTAFVGKEAWEKCDAKSVKK